MRWSSFDGGREPHSGILLLAAPCGLHGRLFQRKRCARGGGSLRAAIGSPVVLEALADGRLDILFAVDMFNEGLDIPNVDTVLMLRPTESNVIWLQQFGRGLRQAKESQNSRSSTISATTELF